FDIIRGAASITESDPNHPHHSVRHSTTNGNPGAYANTKMHAHLAGDQDAVIGAPVLADALNDGLPVDDDHEVEGQVLPDAQRV
ncbi:hypothetical protein, partial [Streptomyces sp. DT9]